MNSIFPKVYIHIGTKLYLKYHQIVATHPKLLSFYQFNKGNVRRTLKEKTEYTLQFELE